MEEPYKLVYKLLLAAHIIGGTVSLLAGLVAMVAGKGGKVHRAAGKLFFVSMIAVAVSAFVISIAKNIPFLLAVSIFSFYMNYTGYRVLKNREVKYKWFDWLVVFFSGATAVYMISTFAVVLIVFGTILIFLVWLNTRVQFQGEAKMKEAGRKKVLTHIANMVGTYIAASTAFLVVNINFVKPAWLLWLLPTLIGTPVIIYFSRVWRKKLKLM